MHSCPHCEKQYSAENKLEYHLNWSRTCGVSARTSKTDLSDHSEGADSLHVPTPDALTSPPAAPVPPCDGLLPCLLPPPLPACQSLAAAALPPTADEPGQQSSGRGEEVRQILVLHNTSFILNTQCAVRSYTSLCV